MFVICSGLEGASESFAGDALENFTDLPNGRGYPHLPTFSQALIHFPCSGLAFFLLLFSFFIFTFLLPALIAEPATFYGRGL